ncbi:acetyl-CoA C-acyltransferase [Massilia sp. GER05]|uniref:acetyl-CoA C-acyltransferase n=1 Tax=Massilia sp. GER05 TaxID=3394605 RepID=UPI003F879BEB
MSPDSVVIVSVARTPIGGFQGCLSSLTAPQLGGTAIKAAIERSGISPDRIDELILGCVLPAGLGQAPARQALLDAGLPMSIPCSTVSKVCGSGMKAVMVAHDTLAAGTNDVVVAGGMESMSNAPYILPKARKGMRLGHGQMLDHMFLDGLEDAYFDKGRLMGTFAEDCATAFDFDRIQQDGYAIASTLRAQEAIKTESFAWEIAPVEVVHRNKSTQVADDEQPLSAQIEKIPMLKPAFKKDGTVTAANSSSISDGAAALVMMRRVTAEKLGVKPLAVILNHTTYAHEPKLFPTAPIGAIRKLLSNTGLSVQDIDLWEINEAFAVVTLAAMRELELDIDKVNIHGGACALGHPIGASGARILVTLIGALRKTGGKRGVASLCIGGGEATAIAIEML